MNWDSKYKTLGLTPEATWDDVKTAFRRLARTYHPDVAGPEGTERFTEITQAYMDLKDILAPGAKKMPRHVGANDSAPAPTKESFWRKLVRKFFVNSGSTEKEREEPIVNPYATDERVHPGRDRFVESILDRAEIQLKQLLQKRDEVKRRNYLDMMSMRLKSKHPAVVLLALQKLSPSQLTNDFLEVILAHYRTMCPSSEVLSALLSLFVHDAEACKLAPILCQYVREYPASDALLLLRWIRRQHCRGEFLPAFLDHPNESVVATCLSYWLPADPLPSYSILLNLLSSERRDLVLLPLLRILRRGGVDSRLLFLITRISKEHANPAVRVWAASIVREQELS